MVDDISTIDNPTQTEFSTNPQLDEMLSWHRLGFTLLKLHSIHFVAGVPVCGCSDGPKCGRIGKHPLEKQKWEHLPPGEAWSEHVIRSRCEGEKQFNFGVVLGPSRLFCIDIDAKDGGWESYEQLVRDGVLHRLEPQVRTGNNGGHVYFWAPDNVDVVKGWRGPNGEYRCATKPLPGLDFKCGNGMCVTPWSQHKNGKFYVPSGEFVP